ncbi:MAG: LysR family transcriptional regulator [Roseburia hominis]|nr:LysR family transcriptional regulator [Roseburia hominis]
MELRTLQYFLAVTREENITRAAENLHISQPYLSKQLMELENELGKQLLIRGKRKITLTEDGILLRKRAEEILSLVEKTESDLSSNTSQISGEISVGGNPTMTVLNAASQLRSQYPDVHFQFYSSDAIDVLERLEHGSLDFAIFLEPIDITEYDYVSLPESSRWGLLMPSSCALAVKDYVEKNDLLKIPLIFHRRAGLQQLISHWADTDIKNFNIAATYNVVNGSPTKFIKSGLGYYLTTEDLLPSVLDQDVCFRPLNPPLEIHYALIWKRTAFPSKAAEMFLREIKH